MKTFLITLAAFFVVLGAAFVYWFPLSYVFGREFFLQTWVSLWPQVVKETPEPWQTVSTGKPNAEFPTPKILHEGTGEVVQIGDFVTLRKFTRSEDLSLPPNDLGISWVWLGFLTRRDTLFYSGTDEDSFEVDSAILGMKVGTLFHFPVRDKVLTGIASPHGARSKDHIAGGGGAIPIGDGQTYGLWAGSAIFDASKRSQPPYIRRQLKWLIPASNTRLGGGGGNIPGMLFQLEKRCPTELRVRRVKLEATYPTLIGPAFDSRIETAPRRMWVQEAELVGLCADGTKMSFRYGPIGVEPPVGVGYGPTSQGHWDKWFQDAWNKIPLGIRIDPEPKM